MSMILIFFGIPDMTPRDIVRYLAEKEGLDVKRCFYKLTEKPFNKHEILVIEPDSQHDIVACWKDPDFHRVKKDNEG